MKIYRISMALISGALLILCFQNCSDFSLQERILYEQGVIDSRNALDAKLLPELLTSSQLKTWYKQELAPDFFIGGDGTDGSLLANQWSVVVAVDSNVSGKFIRVHSSPDEEGSIEVTSGKIRAARSNSTVAFEEYVEASLPTSGSKMVVGASFGAKAGDIKLMVNGIMQKGSVTIASGTPTDFTYISKEISVASGGATIYEYVVFGGNSSTSSTEGLLTYSGLNVMSRYLADNQTIPNVAYDVNLINDGGTGGGSTAPTAEFLAAKTIFDNNCTICHRAGSYNPNLDGLTQSKAISNGWVKAKDLANSPLYTRLKGSTAGATVKDMPQSGSLSAAQVQTIADWIMSIQ